jgi:hypothetical protein
MIVWSARDLKMQHYLTALHLADAQAAELLAADAGIKQGGPYRPIADGLGRRLHCPIV